MIFVSRAIFLCFIASFFMIGLYNLLTDFENNKCEMTYMFEWPKYMVSSFYLLCSPSHEICRLLENFYLNIARFNFKEFAQLHIRACLPDLILYRKGDPVIPMKKG